MGPKLVPKYVGRSHPIYTTLIRIYSLIHLDAIQRLGLIRIKIDTQKKVDTY